MQLDPNIQTPEPNQTEGRAVERKVTSGGFQKPLSSMTWEEIVKGAAAISAKQNGGNVQIDRGCQPELKLCNTVIFFKAGDGSPMMVRRSEDPSGKTVVRDICEFNEFADIRKCVDFDTGATIQEMKNGQKEWIKVGD
jgi:hypothetical protein